MMEVLGLMFAVVLSSAADVQEVAPERSVLDVYASSSQRPAFHGVDLYQGPVIVLANTSKGQDSGLVAYYADNGIRSIVDSRNFQPLHQFLHASPNVSGLVLGYQGFGDDNFLLKVVRDFVLPDNFKLYDLVRESVYTVPIVYVAPKEVFSNHSFLALDNVARFVVDDFNIDQVPVNDSPQPTVHHSANVPIIFMPVFTQVYPYHFQSSVSDPYQNPGSLPSRYQSPAFYPYNYQYFVPHAYSNRGTSLFPLYAPEQGFYPVGYNYKFPNRYPYGYRNYRYIRYPSRYQ